MSDALVAWNAMWQDAHARYVSTKDSQGVLGFLAGKYRQLEPRSQLLVDGVIADSLLSNEEWRRFDALFLVKEFGIRSAIPNLEALAARLAKDDRPGAPFELDKVERIAAHLSGLTVQPG